MFHARFHENRTISSVVKRFLKVFTIYGRGGGHLGHVTWTIYIISLSAFQRGSISNFPLICRAVLEKKSLKIVVMCM